MIKLNCVNHDTFMERFTQLEQTLSEVNGKNSMLEMKLEDANTLVKFHQSKEESLTEERDCLFVTVNKLQQTLQEQFDLRVENERLKNNMADLKQQNETIAELVSKMRSEAERHKRELETVRQQCRREVEDAHRQSFTQLEAKDAEVKKLLEEKNLELEEMKKSLRGQERERQSEILKLQMEFGAKLARVQSTAQWSQQQQQQQHSSNLLPPSVFKRKLQFLQEEKNKEISSLRQRIKDLEEKQHTCSVNDSCLKRRKF
ncbi:Coiled-coil domain-containing protein 152 [Collichthys lucidus]|uniref:Coiled-coil domain-containing protein 152 n=1 Tax=Collichthys lucidus TaxID=240159 RepID=A0A4U5V9M9_COLLU|nr:Coiled-coil domain-containing protein 152 [Collichthys lucidus]